MDVTRAISAYVLRLLTSVSGMKVLLLDEATTPIVSTSMTHSSLLAHEVYLTDRISNDARDRMKHLKCIALLRPEPDTIMAVQRELRSPRYAEYYLSFTGVLSKATIEALAEADEHHVVKEVQEYFADYIPITPSLFSLGYSAPPSKIWGPTPNSWDGDALRRHTEGLTALLLSLKKKPIVRYERMSALAKKLAEDVVYQQTTALSTLFDFRRTDVPPLLLILDRRNDPVTPLLSQWTYQAMVHELMGITNGRVSLAGAQDVGGELKEIVLSADQDPFFAQNLYDNFGDLGASIKRYVLEYQSRTASSSSIETVQDMKKFVEEYPEFRKLGGNVAKHVALLGELSRRVEVEGLLEISELEQSLASQESHAADLRNVNALLEQDRVRSDAKLRLAILYALRYQKYAGNQIASVVERLLKAGVPESRAALVFVVLNLAGAEQRQDDLFANENFFSRGKSALKGLKGVENVYTQHNPHLLETIENLMKLRLRDTSYPFVGPTSPPTQKPQDVILFMIGGATYEEARTVALLNAQGVNGPGGGARFLLGGTTIHNSTSYLDMLQDAASRLPSSIASPPSVGAAGPKLNLSIGPVQIAGDPSAAGGILDPARLGEVVEGGRDLARGLIGRVQGAVKGLQ